MVLDNLVATIGKTKLPDFISNPKGSRQFQQFIKLGSKELRNGAIEALCKQVPELAIRNIYALLTLEKIVTYGLKTDEAFTTEKILKPVMTDRKTVEQLLFHRLGCKFLNKLYMHPLIKPALKKQLCQLVMVPRSVEIFGEAKDKLRQFYLETCARCVDKELLGFEIVQRLLKQAVMDFPVSEDRTFNEDMLNICADGLAHLLSSRDGVVVVVKLLGVSSAKQKKNLIKELKGKFAEMAKNSVTCVLILRLLQCVDDTVLLSKSVLGELNPVAKELMQDPSGRMPYMYILEGLEMKTAKSYFQPDRELLNTSLAPSVLKEREVKVSELLPKCLPLAKGILDQYCMEFVKADRDILSAVAKLLGPEEQRSLIINVMETLENSEGEEEQLSQNHVSCINMFLKEYLEISAVPCWSNFVFRLQNAKSGLKTELLSLCKGLGSFILMNLLKEEKVKKSVLGALLLVKDSLSECIGTKGTQILKESISTAVNPTPWSVTMETFKRPEKTTRKPLCPNPVAPKNKKIKLADHQDNGNGLEELFDEEDEVGEDEDWQEDEDDEYL